MDMKKSASIFFIAVLLLNMILFGLGKIHPMIFWTTIIFGGISAYIIKKWPA